MDRLRFSPPDAKNFRIKTMAGVLAVAGVAAGCNPAVDSEQAKYKYRVDLRNDVPLINMFGNPIRKRLFGDEIATEADSMTCFTNSGVVVGTTQDERFEVDLQAPYCPFDPTDWDLARVRQAFGLVGTAEHFPELDVITPYAPVAIINH